MLAALHKNQKVRGQKLKVEQKFLKNYGYLFDGKRRTKSPLTQYLPVFLARKMAFGLMIMQASDPQFTSA